MSKKSSKKAAGGKNIKRIGGKKSPMGSYS